MIKCKYEDGKEVPLRHVTVDALIEKDGQILLIKRAENYHIEPGKYALPGGFLDRDESCEQGVKREVLEETGYQALTATLFRIIDQPRLKGDDRQNVGFFYLVTVGEKIQEPDFEVKLTHWFPLNQLPSTVSIGFDHLDQIQLFKQFLKKPFTLPLLN
jgi:ADP-ribose pyrophosphatase YjhB (NUDIX family)